MKVLKLIILSLFISSTAYTADFFPRTETAWGDTAKVNNIIEIKSVYRIDNKDLKIIKRVFNITSNAFRQYYKVNINECDLEPLNMFILKSYKELDNKDYFPGEDEYTNPNSQVVMFGRFFRSTNNLYVMPVNTRDFYWERSFAHELLHYFYDECGMKFFNDINEHAEIDRFLKSYKVLY